MKRRLFCIFAVAVIVLSMAVVSFAEMPNTTPQYVREFSNSILASGGQTQEGYTSNYRNVWTSFTCPYCGQSCSRQIQFSASQPYNGHFYLTSFYNTFWQGDGSSQANAFSGIINNTSSGCVYNKGIGIYKYCDYYLSNGRYTYYVHYNMNTVAVQSPYYTSIIDKDSVIGERLVNGAQDNLAVSSNVALSLTMVSPLYDLYAIGDVSGSYNDGYINGFYNGKIQGQEDAEVLKDFEGFFNGLFRGFGAFIDPVLDIGIGKFTVYNVVQLLLTVYLVLGLLKIIRG